MTDLKCSDCPTMLPHNPRRKGTRCKPCSARHVAKSPEHRKAASKAMSRRWKNPIERRALAQSISDGCMKPEIREERRERGKRQRNVKPAPAGSEARQRGGRSLSKTRLGWLPEPYREEYFNLRTNHKAPAAEARRIIEGQMEADLDRFAARGEAPPDYLLQIAFKRDQRERNQIDKNDKAVLAGREVQ